MVHRNSCAVRKVFKTGKRPLSGVKMHRYRNNISNRENERIDKVLWDTEEINERLSKKRINLN